MSKVVHRIHHNYVAVEIQYQRSEKVQTHIQSHTQQLNGIYTTTQWHFSDVVITINRHELKWKFSRGSGSRNSRNKTLAKITAYTVNHNRQNQQLQMCMLFLHTHPFNIKRQLKHKLPCSLYKSNAFLQYPIIVIQAHGPYNAQPNVRVCDMKFQMT